MCHDCIPIKAEKDADTVVIQHLQRRVKELEGILKRVEDLESQQLKVENEKLRQLVKELESKIKMLESDILNHRARGSGI